MKNAFLKSLTDEENLIYIIGQRTLNFQNTKIVFIDYMTHKKNYQTIIHLN